MRSRACQLNVTRSSRTACRAPTRGYATSFRPLPQLGLGTWKAQKEQATSSVKTAIELGYRHIDTAFIYGNERDVGKGISEQKAVKREDLTIVTKLWNTKHKPEDVVAACDQSLKDLGLTYLDMYLIHWPVTFVSEGGPYPRRADGSWLVEEQHPITETWEAMEKLVEAGKTKQIGVCNFSILHLKELLADCRIKPACNQFEMHPYLPQRELVKFCKDNNIQVTAYSSLGKAQEGVTPLLEHSTVVDVAKKNKRTPAQVLLRWALQKGAGVIPKSVTPARIKENSQILDWSIPADDITRLDSLENGTRYVKPDWARYMH